MGDQLNGGRKELTPISNHEWHRMYLDRNTANNTLDI